MLRILPFFFCLLPVMCCCNKGFAQTTSPAVVNAGGRSYTVNNIIIETNIGQPFSSTLGSGPYLTQGLLQPMTPANILPVKDLKFWAKPLQNGDVLLEWSTAAEITNQGFTIESRDSRDAFSKIGFVQSHAKNGNSGTLLQYSYIDTEVLTSTRYYRLKQVDMDGNYIYSPIIVVKNSVGVRIELKAWPSPNNGSFYLSAGDSKTNKQVDIFFINGAKIRSVVVPAGSTAVVSRLLPGVYILKCETMAPIRVVVQ